MFRKILIVAMFATAVGYCYAGELPQVVTSELFGGQDAYVAYDEGVDWQVDQMDQQVELMQDYQQDYQMVQDVPAWPLAGSDADVEIAMQDGWVSNKKSNDNIRIVSKVGADLVVENNFNLGARGAFAGWSGGANMLHGNQIPVGFADDCGGSSEMPLLHREVLEDDGGNVLAVSRSGRKTCGRFADGYDAFAVRNGMKVSTTGTTGSITEVGDIVVVNSVELDEGGQVLADGVAVAESGRMVSDGVVMSDDGTVYVKEGKEVSSDALATVVEEMNMEIEVDESADAEAPAVVTDQVRSWVVANGQTLREVLQSWCDKEGWDLVWTTPREYPIEASAVFKGRFVDVASALVRNFGRATPVPYAKFYKGNRVLVISTTEE